MGQDKKQLEKLLVFIKDLYTHPDNMEFAAGIDAMVMQEGLSMPAKDIQKIREILEIRADLSIDYSFVKDLAVRKQLQIDNLRMENVLLNLTLSEVERYENFCVAAFLQVENLLNYYYRVRHNNDMDKILADIEESTKDTKYPFKRMQNRVYKNVSEVDISKKISAFSYEFFAEGWTLHKLRNIRNEVFHRNGGDSVSTGGEQKKYPTCCDFRAKLTAFVQKVKLLLSASI